LGGPSSDPSDGCFELLVVVSNGSGTTLCVGLEPVSAGSGAGFRLDFELVSIGSTLNFRGGVEADISLSQGYTRVTLRGTHQ
jgi:hypothetical protein